MSYRIDIPHNHKHKHRDTTKIVTPSFINVTNGSIANMAYPCWYIEEHNPRKINPQPPTNRKELIKLWERCIYWDRYHRWCCHPHLNRCHHSHCEKCTHFLDMSKVIPIHLREEYPGEWLSVEVHFEKNEDGTLVLPGLSATATIDEAPYDYVIRAIVTANCEEAQTEPKSSKFSLVLKYDKPDDTIRTVVVNGKVIVWPGIL